MNQKEHFDPPPYNEAVIWQVLIKFVADPYAVLSRNERAEFGIFRDYLLPSIQNKIRLYLNHTFDGKPKFERSVIEDWAVQVFEAVLLCVLAKIQRKDVMPNTEPVAKTFRSFVKFKIKETLRDEQIIKKKSDKPLSSEELKDWYNLHSSLENEDLSNEEAGSTYDDDTIDSIDAQNDNLINDILKYLSPAERDQLMQQKNFTERCKKDPEFNALYVDYNDYLVQDKGKTEGAAKTQKSKNSKWLGNAIRNYNQKTDDSLSIGIVTKLIRRFFFLSSFFIIIS